MALLSLAVATEAYLPVVMWHGMGQWWLLAGGHSPEGNYEVLVSVDAVIVQSG